MVETAAAIELITLERLHAHPKNTHGKLTAKHARVVELKTSIGELGQLETCLVRPLPGKEGEYQILSGHIRVFVLGLLGKTEARCDVRELEDDEALAVLLASNSREPVDPFLEGEAIAALLKTGWTFAQVGNKLGRTPRQVALRANLAKLTAKVRKLCEPEGHLAGWPIEWLEDVARLSPETQDELSRETGDWKRLTYVHSKEELDRVLGEQFHVLGKAPWALEDATLEPGAGACTSCSKTSLKCPELFDDAQDPKDPKALKAAVCRDGSCWRAKQEAFTKRRIAEFKKENKGAVVVKQGYGIKAPAGVKAIDNYSAQVVTAKTKDAKPAVFLTEDGGMTTGFAKVRERPATSRSSAPAKKDGKPPKAGDKNFAQKRTLSMRQVAERRTHLVRRFVREAIEKAPLPADAGVFDGFLSAFGAAQPHYYEAKGEPLEKVKKAYALAGDAVAWKKALWPRILESLDFCDEIDDTVTAWVFETLGLDMAKLEAKAKKEVPDEKWWGIALVEASTPATKTTAGVCRGCGCTDAEGCPEGCAWIEEDLCSSCAGDQPKGKKRAKKAAKS